MSVPGPGCHDLSCCEVRGARMVHSEVPFDRRFVSVSDVFLLYSRMPMPFPLSAIITSI